MKIEVDIQNVNGRYNTQVNAYGFTASEEEKMSEFGEPLIEIGGVFTGTIARPGQANTVVSLTGGGGTGAVLKPVINENGSIVSYTIVSPGTGYTTPPVLAVTGDGSGATATVQISAGAIIGVSPSAVGAGYHTTPVSISFTLPTASIRMRSDFPVKQVFDLADSLDADCQAKLWANAIADRLTVAKNLLIGRASPIIGQTVTTV